jgi:Cu/Ag efflux pump CusA
MKARRVREAIQNVNARVKPPRDYHIAWEGECELRVEARMAILAPLTVLLIFIVFYTMYKSFRWALLILATVAMARSARLLARPCRRQPAFLTQRKKLVPPCMTASLLSS